MWTVYLKWTVRIISRCKKKAKGPWVFLLHYKELLYLDKAFKCYGKKERNWKAFLWPMLRSKQLLFVFHNTTLKAIYLYANVVLFLWPKASMCLQTYKATRVLVCCVEILYCIFFFTATTTHWIYVFCFIVFSKYFKVSLAKTAAAILLGVTQWNKFIKSF